MLLPVRTREGNVGFTLVELLIAITVILVISAIAIPYFVSAIEQGKTAKAAGDIATIRTEISLYQSTYQALPNDLSQIGRDTYLDPWKHVYQYFNLTTLTGNGMQRLDRFMVPVNQDYELYSMGKDGSSSATFAAANSQDDVVRAGGYLGLASAF